MRDEVTAGCIQSLDIIPAEIDTRRNHQPVIFERACVLQGNPVAGGIDGRDGMLQYIDAVLCSQGIVALPDGIHLLQTAQYRIAEGAGYKVGIPFHQCDLKRWIEAAQVPGAGGTAETTADDDHPWTCIGLPGAAAEGHAQSAEAAGRPQQVNEFATRECGHGFIAPSPASKVVGDQLDLFVCIAGCMTAHYSTWPYAATELPKCCCNEV